MVHKPKHKVHSFRGLLADSGEDEINLERQNVNLAYRIIKFDLIPYEPGGLDAEHIVQVWKESQSTPGSTIDFSNPDLLAAGYCSNDTSGDAYPTRQTVIFDNVLFSRNIYVAHKIKNGSGSINYYIEIEEVPVTASTLMQLKLGTARRLIGAKMGA